MSESQKSKRLRAKKNAQIKILFHIREANRAMRALENHSKKNHLQISRVVSRS